MDDQSTAPDRGSEKTGSEIIVRRGPERALTAQQFQGLADVPAAAVWLANIDNPNTRRAYQSDVEAFVGFCGIEDAEEFRDVTRTHVIAWRSTLETAGAPGSDGLPRPLAHATIRRKLSAVSSFFVLSL